jgi:transcriptional regulator with XRE-family HTH domain
MPGERRDEDREGPAGAIGEFIRSQRRLVRLSLRQAAELAKVSNAYLSQIERGIYRPSAKVLSRLADVLQVSAETLYQKAGFLHEDAAGERRDVEESIRLDPRLTPEQKDTLIRVYRGFAGSDRAAPD